MSLTRTSVLEGFGDANFYSVVNAALRGTTAGFSFGALIRRRLIGITGAGCSLVSCWDNATPGGFFLLATNDGYSARVQDDMGAVNLAVSDYPCGNGFLSFVVGVCDNDALFLWANGTYLGAANFGGADYVPPAAGTAFKVSGTVTGQALSGNGYQIGGAFFHNAALTETQINDWWHQIQDVEAFVPADSVAISNVWSVQMHARNTAPATWTPDEGAVSLALSGALTYDAPPVHWAHGNGYIVAV